MNILPRSLSLVLLPTLLISCASAPRAAHFIAPSTAPVTQSAQVIEAKIDAARSHAAKAKTAVETAKKVAPKDASSELTLSLGTASAEIDSLTTELIAAKSESASLQAKIKTLDAQIQDITKTANAAMDQNNKLISENAALKRRYHRLKTYAVVLVVAVAGFLVWKFKSLFLLLGPYGSIAMFALPAAAGALAWLLL